MGQLKRKRVTLWLYPGQIEFLSELRKRFRYQISEAECIRFCINLANVMLDYAPFTDELSSILIEAVDRTMRESRRKRHTKP